jgi:LytS/YehU family sensor histidine kinase
LGIYALWIFVFRSYSFSLTRTMTVEFCYLIFITAGYYILNYDIIPRFLQKKKYLYFVLTTILLIVLSALCRAAVALEMNRLVFHNPQKIDFVLLCLNSAINISIWISLITAGKMILDRMKSQQQLELLEKERIKNELDFLKAQINPHALFNSLNTIYGHIDKNNRVARDILLEFSGLLRYQLYDCSVEKVSLEKEIDYIKNYVSFQQLRKDENLIVQLEAGDIEKDLTIAPLLLVVLIENAFKFVSNVQDRENKILIRLFTKKTVLHGCFFNTTEQQSSPAEKHGGIGIMNLQRRLELLYPHMHELTINRGIDHYQTNLTIDLS